MPIEKLNNRSYSCRRRDISCSTPYASNVPRNSIRRNPEITSGDGSNCSEKDSTSNKTKKFKGHFQLPKHTRNDLRDLNREDTLFMELLSASGKQQVKSRIGQNSPITKNSLCCMEMEVPLLDLPRHFS